MSPVPAPLLLCVDLQPAFLAAISDSQRVHWRCSFALESARGLAVPVLFTEQVPAKLGHTATDLLALAESPVVLAKDTFSALADPATAAHLAGSGARHLLITGIETPICVYQTAAGARQAGYEVTVLADCVGARRAADAAAALAHLAKLGCAVLPAESVFYSLLHDASHPFFRAYTALVKKYG
ncbi:MAG: isochorismatase family protein [Opitutaceae bacterium]|nr:isochorismatase family protein [Opitutaceae bacterium]